MRRPQRQSIMLWSLRFFWFAYRLLKVNALTEAGRFLTKTS